MYLMKVYEVLVVGSTQFRVYFVVFYSKLLLCSLIPQPLGFASKKVIAIVLLLSRDRIVWLMLVSVTGVQK